jgi:hypothetical protein
LTHNGNFVLPATFINASPNSGEVFWINTAQRREQGRRCRGIPDSHFSNAEQLRTPSDCFFGYRYPGLDCAHRLVS